MLDFFLEFGVGGGVFLFFIVLHAPVSNINYRRKHIQVFMIQIILLPV